MVPPYVQGIYRENVHQFTTVFGSCFIKLLSRSRYWESPQVAAPTLISGDDALGRLVKHGRAGNARL